MKVVICISLVVGVFHVLIIDRNKLKDHGNLSWKTIIMLLFNLNEGKIRKNLCFYLSYSFKLYFQILFANFNDFRLKFPTHDQLSLFYFACCYFFK